jgi:hypothetical protein
VTEAEWLGGADPRAMLEFLRGKASDRKGKLFSVACCLRVWHLLADERLHEAVILAERHADGEATDGDMAEAVEAISRVSYSVLEYAVYSAARSALGAALSYAMTVAQTTAEAVARYAIRPIPPTANLPLPSRRTIRRPRLRPQAQRYDAIVAERLAQCLLLRDISHNPFCPPPPLTTAVLNWSDGTVRRIAQGIYEERAFHHLTILADALLDAGCEDDALIAHCRSAGPHVRGCWAVDLILGKE